MIICFRCSGKTKDQLDYLLGSQDYKDYADVIASAVENMVYLHNEMADSRSVTIGAVTDDGKKLSKADAKSVDSLNETGARLEATPQKASTQADRVPDLFSLNGLSEVKSNVPMIPTPESTGDPIKEFPLDEWVFGQYNRFLPLKANSRALAHLLCEHPEGVPLEHARSRIAEQAVLLGDFLRNHDMQNKLRRDESLATAFPSSGKKQEQSILRYASHFVADYAKNSRRATGFPVDMLLFVCSGEKPRLNLTEQGWRFAELSSPILDGDQSGPDEAFSDKEREFLIDHIHNSIPQEAYAYRVIREAIQAGANTPDDMDAWLMEHLPRSDESRSDGFLQSQRSGAIARMADIGLITRVRNGVKVRYEV